MTDRRHELLNEADSNGDLFGYCVCGEWSQSGPERGYGENVDGFRDHIEALQKRATADVKEDDNPASRYFDVRRPDPFTTPRPIDTPAVGWLELPDGTRIPPDTPAPIVNGLIRHIFGR